MIQKPPGDWYRDATPLEQRIERAAAVARAGTQAARRGGRAVRGTVCWSFAVLWGFCALGGLAMGNVPLAAGVAAMAAGMMWAGKRAFAQASDDPTSGPASSVMASAIPEQEIRYSRGRLVAAVAVGCVLAWISAHLVHGRGLAPFVFGICLVAGIAYAGLAGWRLFGDPVALAWNDDALTVTTLWRRRAVRRDQILSIALSRRTMYVYGFIPAARIDTLVIDTYAAGKLRLAARLLSLPGRTAAGLAAELTAWRHAAPSRPSRDRPQRPVSGVTPASASRIDGGYETGFDPDAIMARYLADKHAAATSATEPALPRKAVGFGRKAI